MLNFDVCLWFTFPGMKFYETMNEWMNEWWCRFFDVRLRIWASNAITICVLSCSFVFASFKFKFKLKFNQPTNQPNSLTLLRGIVVTEDNVIKTPWRKTLSFLNPVTKSNITRYFHHHTSAPKDTNMKLISHIFSTKKREKGEQKQGNLFLKKREKSVLFILVIMYEKSIFIYFMK